MYPSREVFSDSPLALVAAEIRFSDAARLRQQSTLDAVTIALEERFPIAEPLQLTDLNLALPTQIQHRSGVVLKNQTSSESLTVHSSSLTYETTAYGQFEELLSAVGGACAALVDASIRPALLRVGLRYIDEVRVTERIEDARQWSSWVDGRLVDHLAVGPDSATVTGTQGLIAFDLGNHKGLNFRFAALDQGPVVVSQHLRRRHDYSPGPFFVLDFDGYEEFTGDLATLLDPEVVRKSLSAVHGPVGATFQRTITDKARELFRGGNL